MKGSVVPEGARGKLDRVCKAAGLSRWPKNGLRHCSRRIAWPQVHDAPRVAGELGHTSPQMLYSTYSEVVLPEEAELYWKLVPESKAENVLSFSSRVTA